MEGGLGRLWVSAACTFALFRPWRPLRAFVFSANTRRRRMAMAVSTAPATAMTSFATMTTTVTTMTGTAATALAAFALAATRVMVAAAGGTVIAQLGRTSNKRCGMLLPAWKTIHSIGSAFLIDIILYCLMGASSSFRARGHTPHVLIQRCAKLSGLRNKAASASVIP